MVFSEKSIRTDTDTMSRHSATDDLAGAAGVSIAILCLVLLLFVLYVVVKACNLIIRAFAKSPKNKPLWIALIIFLVCASLIVVTRGNAVCTMLAVCSLLGLVITARIVELYYNDLFQEETTLVQNVLRKPWWEGSQQQLSA